MRVAVSHTIENAYWTSVANAIDADGNPGTLKLYSGPVPARGVAVGPSNNLIAQFTLAYPCWDSISDGVLTFDTIPNAVVLDASAHTFGRFEDGAGNWVMDVDTGVVNTPLPDGSYAAWQFNLSSYGVGGLLLINTLSLAFPP